MTICAMFPFRLVIDEKQSHSFSLMVNRIVTDQRCWGKGVGNKETLLLIIYQAPHFHQGLEQEEPPLPPKTHVLISPPL